MFCQYQNEVVENEIVKIILLTIITGIWYSERGKQGRAISDSALTQPIIN